MHLSAFHFYKCFDNFTLENNVSNTYYTTIYSIIKAYYNKIKRSINYFFIALGFYEFQFDKYKQ